MLQRRLFTTSRKLLAVSDPYKVLGIDKTADKAKVKKAYFALAKKYHPDSNKEASAKDKYIEVQHAYELLNDPVKKQQYDSYGASAFDESGNSAGPGGFGAGSGGGFGGGSPFGQGGFNFEDLFSQFGGQRQQARNTVLVGDPIEVAAGISFMDAAKGASKNITIEPLSKCKPCSGSGLRAGEKRTSCMACGGLGTRMHVMQGGFQMATTCEVCAGSGVVIPRGKECSTCTGEGVVRERKSVKIDVPAGVEDGMRLRVTGEGDAPHTSGSPPNTPTRNGDLYVHIRVAPSTQFKRDGANITYKANIPMTTAALGGRVKVPTLDGDVELKVTSGTATGDAVTMSGKGLPRLSPDGRPRGMGDLTIEFKVNIPKRISPYERNLLEQLAISLGDSMAKREMTNQINTQGQVSASNASNTSNKSSTTSGSGSTTKNDGKGFIKSVLDKFHHKDTSSNPSSSEEEPQKASGSGS